MLTNPVVYLSVLARSGTRSCFMMGLMPSGSRAHFLNANLPTVAENVGWKAWIVKRRFWASDSVRGGVARAWLAEMLR